jgi:CRISPR/Cas system-associated exonuclease Cas4 (RecB family)
MHWVFEEDEKAEITQVLLWGAYRSHFEHLEVKQRVSPMLAAADLIKEASSAYKKALPQVMVDQQTGERKFIIKGMKIRDRQGGRAVFDTCTC